jgi:excisionase family DNA binding protein
VTERLAYRVNEAADAIGISRARAYELIAEGVIPSIRIGSSIRVPVDQLKALIAKRQAEQPDTEAAAV